MSRNVLKVWRRWLAGVLLVSGLAILGLMFLLQTEAGRQCLAALLSRQLSSEHRVVRLEGLRVMLPDKIRLGRLAVADDDGEWLNLQGVNLQVDVRALMERRIEVGQMKVSGIELARWPVSRDEPESRTAPGLPVFRVESVRFEEIRLGESVCGFPVTLSGLGGHVQGGGGGAFPVDAAMSLKSGSVGAFSVTGAEFHVSGPWGALALSGEARLGPVQIGSLDVTGAKVSASGVWRALTVAGTAEGVLAGQPVAADVGGRVKWDTELFDLELSRATLGFAGVRATATQPLRVMVDGGTSTVAAAWHAEVSDLEAVSNVVSQGIKGRMTGDLRVCGTLAAPELEGRVVYEGLTTPWHGLSSLSAVSGACTFGLSNGLLNGAMSAGLATGCVVKATAQMPVQLSLQPWALRWDRDGNLFLAIEAGLNLGVLKRLDALANGKIGGRVDLAVAHYGSWNSGSVTGTCVLAAGEYENYLLGSVIRDASVRLVAQDGVLRVESGTADDAGKGRFSLTGAVQLDPARGFPYTFEIGCHKARLMSSPVAAATVSGKVGLEGTLSWIRADGKLQIEEALVQLQNLRPAPPEALGAAKPVPVSAATRGQGATNVTLRLAVDIPGNLYIRGKTLDSAWAGNLVLGYAGGLPSVNGFLEPRRGTILLLKRPFKLSEGRIDFNELWPPDPSLRLVATYSRPDLQAQVSVVGKTGNPEIILTSVPALPEDEILARILFGKDMSTVTPLQALSLASEATKLRKIGGGTGVMGDVQEAVGIDRVEFREAGEGSAKPEVAAGKYLGDRSYVEMRRTTSSSEPGQTRIYLEHELRPNIVLEAESGIEMRSGVGIFWKRDY